MDINIRKASISDFEELCSIFEEADKLHVEKLPDTFREAEKPVRPKEFIISIIYDEKQVLYVAELHKEIIGCIHVCIINSPPIPIFVKRLYGEIDTICVSSKYRHVGVGKLLMREAEIWLKENGVHEVELNVYHFNKSAIGLYEKLGYQDKSKRMTKKIY